MILSRLLCVACSVLGFLSILLPWWTLTWTWEGGVFRTSTFLYSNSISGDLGALGLPTSVVVNTSAYDFAQTALGLNTLAVMAGILGTMARGRWYGRLSVFTSALLVSSVIVFLWGLSSTLSNQGRSIFSSVTLVFQGSTSTVTSGLAAGFYIEVGAACLALASYWLYRQETMSRTLTTP